MKRDTKPITFHMNRSFRLTQLSFFHRTCENGNTASIYILYWKNEIFLFLPSTKGDTSEEGNGKEINPKDKTRTFRVLLTIFTYLGIGFFPHDPPLSVMLCTLWSSSKCRSVRNKELCSHAAIMSGI